MKNAVPVSAQTLEMDNDSEQPTIAVQSSPHFWIEVVAGALLIAAFFVGIDFWKEWFSSTDRIICSVCVGLGLMVALFRSNWQGELSRVRVAFAMILFVAAAATLATSFSLGRLKLSGIACGLILAAWCSLRVRGESLQHALSLGLVFAIPTAIDACAARGAFDWLESVSISVTSGLADAAEQSHVREGDRLLFGLGVADQFSCLGEWDSVVSFFGIAVFCVLSFRRNLLAGAITLVMSAVVWIAVRGSAWVAIAWLGNVNQVWYDWSPGLVILLFAIGAILLISIDQFFSTLLEPIPFEFINTDFPLFAFLWNWICGLPKLTVSVPQREDFSQDEIDD